jgi:DNA modification methylase
MLCERLMAMFLRRTGKQRILDPFMGSGSTLLAARGLGKVGIGFEISPAYIEMAKKRLEAPTLFKEGAPEYFIHQADARHLLDHVKPNSINMCITSPPYWDILNQKRTADSKNIRHYGNLEEDLGTIADYAEFLDILSQIFAHVLEALRPSAYCAVVVMDLRKKDRFYPFHSDLASRLTSLGFILDDIIIWDRGREYNNLRPLGYPSVFRVNKIHEFVMIFKKPDKSNE